MTPGNPGVFLYNMGLRTFQIEETVVDQMTLQKNVIRVMFALLVIFMIISRNMLNLVSFIVIGSSIIALPFWLDSLIRYHFTPWIDSLNIPNGRYDDFPLSMRVLIWAFLGFILSFLWSWIIPLLLGLPLWIGRLISYMGWHSLQMNDWRWQYGWMIAFLVQYLVNFGAGAAAGEETDIEQRFDYPDK